MSISAFYGGARRRLVEEIDACIHQNRQAKMHSDLDRDSFIIDTEILFYFVQRVSIS